MCDDGETEEFRRSVLRCLPFREQPQERVEDGAFNVNALGSDGSHLVYHENDEAATNANGVITVTFDHAFCA